MTPDEVKISVLMPAYNTEAYIGEAIQSVLKQTFEHFELIIINDGSTDNTENIIRSIQDPRIVLINQSNQGVSQALNTGLMHARGEYIARFDADDICYPERLQIQYDYIRKNPEYILLGSDADYVDKNGEYLYYYGTIGHTHEEICSKINTYCPFIHASVLYKKDIVMKLGGYNPKAHTFEDYLLWTELIKMGKVYNFNIPLIAVRLNPESVTVDEKLRGKRFNKLKKEMIFGSKGITEEQERELINILKNQNFGDFKHHSYHVLVAKKYLWNNHDPAKARQNILKAIGFRPFHFATYGMLFLSFLPEPVISLFYKIHKAVG
ncbi:MAG TPA: glycosyltransferase [Puia sp.]|nr:glycosyltransferase [Puia sp.]